MSTKSSQNFKLVMVEWLDAFSGITGEAGWHYLDDMQKEPITCQTVGFLAHDAKGCMVIVPHMSNPPKETDRQGAGYMMIPKGMIVRVIELVPKSRSRR